MRAAWIPEPLGNNPEPLDQADFMLDRDAKPARPLVVFRFLRGPFAAFGFLVGIIEGFMFLVVRLHRPLDRIDRCRTGRQRNSKCDSPVCESL